MKTKIQKNGHPDERTIELFVIHSEQVKSQREEISKHLSSCAGCAALHKEIAEYYADVARLQEVQEEKASHALYAPDRAIRPALYNEAGGIVAQRSSIPRRFVASVTRYPVRWAGGIVLIAVALALVLPQVFQHDTNPAFARAKNEFLIVSNKSGEELWRKHIGPGYDLNEGPRWISSHHDEAALAYDVDGDGTKEVLAVFGWMSHLVNMPIQRGVLCFNADGSERWRYEIHRTIAIGGVPYSDDYRAHMMVVGAFAPDKVPRVLISASHNPWFPNLLVSLDARDGSFLGEYWHPGIIACFGHKDLDGDGVDNFLFAGQNNRLGKACLVVFDPRTINGAAPVPKGSSPDGSPPGTEKYYIVFPPSDLEQKWVDITNQAIDLTVRSDGLIEVVIMEVLQDYRPELYYYFDSTLTCVRVRGSDHFTAAHKMLEKEGRLARPLNDAYFENLRHQVLYWDGERFVKKPTMVMRRQEVVSR